MADMIEQAKLYVQYDINADTKQQVQKLIDENDVEELKNCFASRVSFGTAGLRAEMGPGWSRLNDLVILQTIQGICVYLENSIGKENTQQRGIVIGYDHRKRGSISSTNFAYITAAVCLQRGIKVYLFNKFVATPLVPFSVTEYNAAMGVMITASHNPKDDNGYKVYYGNGCQIIPPHDEGIAKCILENLKPFVKYDIDPKSINENKLCIDITDEIESKYYESIKSNLYQELKFPKPLNITYTAMHGVGYPFVQKIFDKFQLPQPHVVKKQILPDALFPTVEFPNPEEGAGALALACEAAKKTDSTLILANDPDADRLAVAELNRETNEWKIFSGNEIACLLGYWQWMNYQKQSKANNNKKQKKSKGAAMVASTVSSKFLKAMAAKEGFEFQEVLTGFKWIGNKAIDLQNEGYDVIFSYEQAIGFCCGTVVNDKDGVSAAAVFAQMANDLNNNNLTCLQQYEVLREKYGKFESNDSYVFCHDNDLKKKVFDRLRNDGHYWLQSNGYTITSVRDLKSPGYDSSTPDKLPNLPVSSGTMMITYTFANGCVATLRASGTEPKLKWYVEHSGKADVETVRLELNMLVEKVIKNDMLRDCL